MSGITARAYDLIPTKAEWWHRIRATATGCDRSCQTAEQMVERHLVEPAGPLRVSHRGTWWRVTSPGHSGEQVSALVYEALAGRSVPH